jgi:hypothetical protein
LVEISVVSTPANPKTLFTLAKSVKSFFDNLNTKNMEMEKEHVIKYNSASNAEIDTSNIGSTNELKQVVEVETPIEVTEASYN